MLHHDQKSPAITLKSRCPDMSYIPFLKGWKEDVFIWPLGVSTSELILLLKGFYVLCSEQRLNSSPHRTSDSAQDLSTVFVCVLVAQPCPTLCSPAMLLCPRGPPDKNIGVGCPQYSRISYLELHMIFLANHQENIHCSIANMRKEKKLYLIIFVSQRTVQNVKKWKKECRLSLRIPVKLVKRVLDIWCWSCPHSVLPS